MMLHPKKKTINVVNLYMTENRERFKLYKKYGGWKTIETWMYSLLANIAVDAINFKKVRTITAAAASMLKAHTKIEQLHTAYADFSKRPELAFFKSSIFLDEHNVAFLTFNINGSATAEHTIIAANGTNIENNG